jgi:hypothetical protein
MAGPPDAEHGRLTMVFSGAGIPNGAVTTIGVRKGSGDIVNADLVPLAAAAKTLHGQIASNTVNLQHIELKRGPDAIGPTWTEVVNQPGAGNQAAAPPNVAILIRKELNDLSAKFSGRMYWPGAQEPDVNEAGNLTPTYQTGIQNALNAFQVAVRAAGFELVVFHEAGGIDLSGEVVRLALQNRVATQRRRLRR